MLLKDRNCIFSPPPSIDDLLDPIEEKENLDSEAKVFKDDAAIITEVHRQEAVWNGDTIKVDLDDEGHDNELPAMATSELLVLAEKMKAGYVSRVSADSLLDFLHHLYAFRAELRRDQMKNVKQVTLDGFFKQA